MTIVLSARQVVIKVDASRRAPLSLCLMGGPESPETPAKQTGRFRRERLVMALTGNTMAALFLRDNQICLCKRDPPQIRAPRGPLNRKRTLPTP